jgi:hypothetical protein
MMGKRVLAIGLDPHASDFASDFFRGQPLKDANMIADGIKADETRLRQMGHDFQWLLIDARGGPEAASAGPRGTGGAASGGGGDRRRCPVRSRADARPGGAGEHGDPGRAWGAASVQHVPDHFGGGGWMGFLSPGLKSGVRPAINGVRGHLPITSLRARENGTTGATATTVPPASRPRVTQGASGRAPCTSRPSRR